MLTAALRWLTLPIRIVALLAFSSFLPLTITTYAGSECVTRRTQFLIKPHLNIESTYFPIPRGTLIPCILTSDLLVHEGRTQSFIALAQSDVLGPRIPTSLFHYSQTVTLPQQSEIYGRIRLDLTGNFAFADQAFIASAANGGRQYSLSGVLLDDSRDLESRIFAAKPLPRHLFIQALSLPARLCTAGTRFYLYVTSSKEIL